jgi:hypothetical protein
MAELENTGEQDHPGDDASAVPPDDAPTQGCEQDDDDDDEAHLQRFGCMLDLIADRTRAVGERYHNGCYIVGRPGTSKTYTVVATLKGLDVPWTSRNGRLSAAGLYALLHEHPEHAIVLDDVPSIVSDRASLQILMAALGGEPGKPRTVSYTTKGPEGRVSFEFRGGVIALSNLPLRRDPLVDAVQSRVPLLEHEPSDEMIAAFMRRRAAEGFEDLCAAECLEVVEYVIEQTRACDYRLDLRAMTKGWQDFRLAKHRKARRPWRELVASSLKRIVAGDPDGTERGAATLARTREATKAREQRLARELFERYPSASGKAARDAEWHAATDKTAHALYRRGREVFPAATRVGPPPATAAAQPPPIRD